MLPSSKIALFVCISIAATFTAVCASTSTSTATTRPAYATMNKQETWVHIARRRIEAAQLAGPVQARRTKFGIRPLATVRGWPSIGGYLVMSCDGVELEFLGLDRFESAPRSTDLEEEDAHCNRMRMLGAKWWASERHESKYESDRSLEDELEDDVKFFGWPSSGGGVWALYLKAEDAAVRGAPGKIFNTRNMDERCEWIEKLGGTFHADPNDCPHLDLEGKLEYNTTAASTGQCGQLYR